MADSQRKTANLAPTSEFTNDITDTRAVLQIMIRLYNGSSIVGNTTYDVTEVGTFSFSSPVSTVTSITRVYIKHNGSSRDIPILDINVDYANGQFQFTADYQSINPQTVGGIKLKNIMLNYGSTPLPYEPYSATGWLHSLRKLTTATEAIQSGDTIYANGQPITTYTLKGNEEHTGTPSPQNPVMPNGVGVRTENKFDYSDLENGSINPTDGSNMDNPAQKRTKSYMSVIGGESYCISNLPSGGSVRVHQYKQDKTYLGSNIYSSVFTTDATCAYVRISAGSGNFNPNVMLNTGSTAKPFEPYGYKIPISNGQQTTNIDLGSTQTVRQIKKLVLTGDESGWIMGASNVGKRFGYNVPDAVESNTSKVNSILSHLPLTVSGGTNLYPNTYAIGADKTLLIVLDSNYTSLDQFLDWIRGQYNNGTPVTLWYRTATPYTDTINEPLMKIGNFADTLSNAASIPTTEGANSITVDTAVQPSEFTATWTGWHNANVKEWDGSQWNE